MFHRTLFVLACGLVPILGCGQSASEPHAPSGNELQQYLSEHPELNHAVEPESTD